MRKDVELTGLQTMSSLTSFLDIAAQNRRTELKRLSGERRPRHDWDSNDDADQRQNVQLDAPADP